MALRFRRLCLVAFLSMSLLLTGCASRLSYKFIDIWLAWSVDDYVTLTDAQEALLDQRVEVLIDWHRQTQLPRYIEWMTGFRERVTQPMSAEDITAEFNDLNTFADAILLRIEPEILVLLATLNDKQIKELEKNLLRDNDEILEDYRDVMSAKRQQRRENSATTNVQRWIGKVNRQQRVLLRNWSRELADVGEERYKTRDQWQAALFQALTLREKPEQFQQAIRPLLFNPQAYRSEQYTKQLADNQRKTFVMLASIQQSLDKQQKKRLDLSIDSWSDTFKSLADID